MLRAHIYRLELPTQDLARTIPRPERRPHMLC
jgi:hypothetical protein